MLDSKKREKQGKSTLLQWKMYELRKE